MERIKQEVKSAVWWVLAAILIAVIKYASAVMQLTVFSGSEPTVPVASACLIFLPGMILTVASYVLVWKILDRMIAGRVFVLENVGTLKMVAYLQIVRVLALSALDLFYRHSKIEYTKLDLIDNILIIYGLFLASHILEAACKLHEDNQLVI